MSKFQLVAALLLFTSTLAIAQSGSFTISGAVHDQSGADVPNALVTLSLSGANSGSRTTRTNADGIFSFDRVGGGNYAIQVQLEGQAHALIEQYDKSHRFLRVF